MTDAWGGAWGISFGSAWGAAAQGVPLVIPHGAVPGGGGSPFPMNRHYTFPLRARRTRRRRDEEFFILRAAA